MKNRMELDVRYFHNSFWIISTATVIEWLRKGDSNRLYATYRCMKERHPFPCVAVIDKPKGWIHIDGLGLGTKLGRPSERVRNIYLFCFYCNTGMSVSTWKQADFIFLILLCIRLARKESWVNRFDHGVAKCNQSNTVSGH